MSEVAELEEEEEEEEVPFASHSISQQVLLLLWRDNTCKRTPTLHSKAFIIGVGRDSSAENIVNGDRRHMYTCVIVRLILVLVIYSKQTLIKLSRRTLFYFLYGKLPAQATFILGLIILRSSSSFHPFGTLASPPSPFPGLVLV